MLRAGTGSGKRKRLTVPAVGAQRMRPPQALQLSGQSVVLEVPCKRLTERWRMVNSGQGYYLRYTSNFWMWRRFGGQAGDTSDGDNVFFFVWRYEHSGHSLVYDGTKRLVQ
jgi:hypothetical protein